MKQSNFLSAPPYVQFLPEISMLKSALSPLLLTALAFSAAQAADTIGFKETELPDAGGDRPLHVSIWYPTDDTG